MLKKMFCSLLIAMLLTGTAIAESLPFDLKALDTQTLLAYKSAIEAELLERDGGNNSSRSFSLHGDVRFGMSLDEVTDIELQQGFYRSEEDDKPCKFRPQNDETVAGMRNAKVYYAFDDAGRLFMMEYSFSSGASYETRDRLSSQLTKKYGEPTAYVISHGFSSEGKGERIVTPVELYGVVINPLSFRGSSGGYQEWLLEEDDGYIFIQHAFFINSYNNYEQTIVYCYFDRETYHSFYQDSSDDL